MKLQLRNVFVFAIILILITGCNTFNQSTVFLTTSPSNNTFKIELIGNPNNPNIFSAEIENETRFNLFKKDQLIVENEYLDRYDHFDSGFGDMYPEHKWERESVLRFGQHINKWENRTDFLTVLNKTDKRIKYVKIVARDMLLIFELPPKSNMKLEVPHQPNHSWIWGYGKFANGKPIKGSGANFYHKDKLNQPLRYCLSIEDNNIKVESPIMDGFFDNDSTEQPDKPMNQNCDL